MKGLLSSLVLIALFAVPASGVPLIHQEDTWDYTVLDFDLLDTFTDIGYNDFPWDSADWIEGRAGFGNGNVPQGGTINTEWTMHEDLALRKSFSLDSVPVENLRLDIAVDNGCVVFINDHEVSRVIAEGSTYLWEHSIEIGPQYLRQGTNTVSVLAEDHGYWTYFDMQLEVVPEPATILLLGFGAVWVRMRRKSRMSPFRSACIRDEV